MFERVTDFGSLQGKVLLSRVFRAWFMSASDFGWSRTLCLFLAKAKEIDDRVRPVTDIIYGYRVGLPVTHFHYRYKVAAWLIGLIARPHIRLPQMAIPLKEVKMLREAMIKSGLPMVREAEQFKPSPI